MAGRPPAAGYSAWFLRTRTVPPRSGAKEKEPLLACPGTPLLSPAVHSPNRKLQSVQLSLLLFWAERSPENESKRANRSNFMGRGASLSETDRLETTALKYMLETR